MNNNLKCVSSFYLDQFHWVTQAMLDTEISFKVDFIRSYPAERLYFNLYVEEENLQVARLLCMQIEFKTYYG